MAGFGIDRSSAASGAGASASSISEAIIDAKGDLIAGASADTPIKVTVGANETRLVADSTQAGGLKYVADTTNYAVAAKGDILVGTAADTLAALTVGAAGELLMPASGTASGLAWLRAPAAGAYIINGKISRSVAGNALTIAVKTLGDADPSTSSPVYILMPTATSNVLDGGYVGRQITGALSMTVSNGSTLGHSNATAAPVFVYLLDNAGTLELAASAKFFGGASVQTTTAEGGAGAADSRTVLYSTTLRSNVVVACLQSWESTQTTAGTWAATTGQVVSYPFRSRSIGSDGDVQVADSTQVDGYRWDTPYRRKNAIINGDFNVWQRGTSFTSIAHAAYNADRWAYYKTGAMVHDVSRSTDVPTVAEAGRLFNYSFLVDCTTVDAAIAAGDYCFVAQKIEGYNWLPLAQRAVTVSFWVKGTKTGIHCAHLVNSGNDRSCVKEFTINTTDTWEKKTLTYPASPSAGTWDYTTGVGVWLSFVLAAGSTFHTTADAYQTGQFFSTANQVNATDSTSNNFRLCGVQLEAGSVATEFEQRTFPEELALCQRYYEKSFAQATAPVQNSGNFDGTVMFSVTIAATNVRLGSVHYRESKRASATITTYNPSAANANGRDHIGGVDISSLTVEGSAFETGFHLYGDTSATAAGRPMTVHWQAVAEL